jgi:hypothetical protein
MRRWHFDMTGTIDRRAFLHRAALVTTICSPFARAALRSRAPEVLRVGFVTDDAPHARRLGFDLGVAEAKRSAQLFGGGITVAELHAPVATAVDVIVGGTTRAQCLSLAGDAARIGAVFLNVGGTDDALRGADCRAAMFHVAPSDAMLRDAVALAKANGAATAWDAALTRFGADTLNDRFRATTGEAMTADAWLAWVAVKIIWEASLRARTTSGAGLAAHLVRETTQFDGHKGRPLGFRAWDHQLRQPLYVVVAGPSRRLIEEPVAQGDETARESLDRLGTTAANSTCHITS